MSDTLNSIRNRRTPRPGRLPVSVLGFGRPACHTSKSNPRAPSWCLERPGEMRQAATGQPKTNSAQRVEISQTGWCAGGKPFCRKQPTPCSRKPSRRWRAQTTTTSQTAEWLVRASGFCTQKIGAEIFGCLRGKRPVSAAPAAGRPRAPRAVLRAAHAETGATLTTCSRRGRALPPIPCHAAAGRGGNFRHRFLRREWWLVPNSRNGGGAPCLLGAEERRGRWRC